MKTLAQSVLTVGLVVVSAAAFAAEGIVTMAVHGDGSSNVVTITEGQVATVKSYVDGTLALFSSTPQPVLACAFLSIFTGTNHFYFDPREAFFFGHWPQDETKDFTIAGPATIVLETVNSWELALLTLDIQPTPFRPDKAATLGPSSGDVKVTMEASTNLVDWVTATNGLVYTNSPAARFFRIRMEKTANP